MNAVLKKHNGAMTLFINDKPYIFTTYKPTELNDDHLFEQTVFRSVKDMADRGVHVHFVPVYFGWSGEGLYDFAPVDKRVNLVLEADSEAYVVIRIQAESMAPKWWLDENPDAIVRHGLGRAPEPPEALHRTRPSPSLASNFWEKHALDALKELAEYVKKSEYSSRVIGYLPTAYNTNEWFIRSYDDLQVTDLCPAMQKAFNQYLQQKTGQNDREFHVPDRIERGCGDHGYLMNPDPKKARSPVMEYYRFINNLCANRIISITAALRQAHLPDKIIIGTFYGYAQGLANFYWLPDSGHLSLARLMQSEGPDFTCSPLEYFTRNVREDDFGGFCWAQSSAPCSGLLWDKAYFGEDDFCPPGYGKPIGWSSAGDPTEDAEMLKRNFCFTLCKGQLQWWYDLHGHWYEDDKRLEAVQQCAAAAEEAINADRSQVSQIAVVMDEQASWYVSLDKQFQRAVFWENFYKTFGQIGTAVDLLLLSDLEKIDTERYHAIFFPTCFALNNKQRDIISGLKNSNRTLVFYQADGYINPDSERPFSSEAMSELIGINVADTDKLFQMRLTTGTDHSLLAGVENTCFGLQTEKTLNFVVDDSQAEQLAYFSGRGPLGMALKRHDDWSSIYCAVPAMPCRLARNIAIDAGVHIYNFMPDVLYANKSYIALYPLSSGKREIFLPRQVKVKSCLGDVKITANTPTSFEFEADALRSCLFKFE